MQSNTLRLEEDKSTSYAPRTYHNAHIADLTVALAADFKTAGERLTKKAAGDKYMAFPIDTYDPIDCAREIYVEMHNKNMHTINIAGNGIYTLNDYLLTQEFVNNFVYSMLKPLNTYLDIRHTYSGGQSGVDLAGGVASLALGIPCTMRYPKGFKTRGESGVDTFNSPYNLYRLIEGMAIQLRT